MSHPFLPHAHITVLSMSACVTIRVQCHERLTSSVSVFIWIQRNAVRVPTFRSGPIRRLVVVAAAAIAVMVDIEVRILSALTALSLMTATVVLVLCCCRYIMMYKRSPEPATRSRALQGDILFFYNVLSTKIRASPYRTFPSRN